MLSVLRNVLCLPLSLGLISGSTKPGNRALLLDSSRRLPVYGVLEPLLLIDVSHCLRRFPLLDPAVGVCIEVQASTPLTLCTADPMPHLTPGISIRRTFKSRKSLSASSHQEIIMPTESSYCGNLLVEYPGDPITTIHLATELKASPQPLIKTLLSLGHLSLLQLQTPHRQHPLPQLPVH